MCIRLFLGPFGVLAKVRLVMDITFSLFKKWNVFFDRPIADPRLVVEMGSGQDNILILIDILCKFDDN